MTKLLFITAWLFCSAGSFAQKQSGSLPYNKEHLDSLFKDLPQLKQPFMMPVPKGYTAPENIFTEKTGNFEAANPGATVISRSARGTVYNMPLDNMAVLVPDMNGVERMPASQPAFRNAPRDRMPNPLYHRHQQTEAR